MRISWRSPALRLSLLVMEGCWLFVLLYLLDVRGAGGRLTPLMFFPLYLAAFVVNQWLMGQHWHRLLDYGLNALLLLIGVILEIKFQLYPTAGLFSTEALLALPHAIGQLLTGIKPEVIILLASLPLWWLGRRLGRVGVNFAAILTDFQFGLVGLVVLFYIGTRLQAGLPFPIPLTLTFFGCALAGIALAHSQDTNAGQGSRGLWITLALVSIVLILLAGLALSAAVTPGVVQSVWNFLGMLWNAFDRMVAYLVGLLPFRSEGGELPPSSDTGGELTPGEYNHIFNLPDWLRQVAHYTFIAIFLGFFIAMVWMISAAMVRRLRRLATPGEQESLRGAFRADFLGFFRRLGQIILGWLGRKPRPAATTSELAPVRRVYRELLRWAARRGYPRAASQTPYEYLATLQEDSQIPPATLELITEQYISYRYGGAAPTAAELASVETSWRQIQQTKRRTG